METQGPKHPVVEVVCGAVFHPLRELLAPHLGLFWKDIKSEYPRCREVGELASLIEGDPAPVPQIEIRDVPPLPRVWFIGAAEANLIQLQRDRFHYNWRRTNPIAEYPRFPSVVDSFLEMFDRFRRFLAENEIPHPHVRQFELTYLNHFVQGDGWRSLDDLGNLFPHVPRSHEDKRRLAPPQHLNWQTVYPLPFGPGRLYVTVRGPETLSGKGAVIVFELTARGMGPEDVAEWFKKAHEFVVTAYKDLHTMAGEPAGGVRA